MNNHITYQQVVSRLNENMLGYLSLPVNAGEGRMIVTQRGGRVLGPFLGENGESLLWMNAAFADPEAFRIFLSSGDWNLGGERVYIGPELQYAVPDRQQFWKSYTLSPDVDPGHYDLVWDKPNDQCRLYQEMLLDAYPNLGKKALCLTRLMGRARDPLRNLDDYKALLDGIIYCGYYHQLTLAEKSSDRLMSQTWDLTQINPGGVLIMPVLPDVTITDYYDPVDETWQTVGAHHVCLRISGDHKFKLGYKAPHVLGRAGYLNRLDEDRLCFIFRQFYSNPFTLYLDEPFDKPGCKGDSLQIYQDDGALGGFAEIECIGQPIGGITNRTRVTDDISLSFYIGPPQKVLRIAHHLVGVFPDEVLRDWEPEK